MKLLVNEAKLTGLWARNWATILTGFDLKFALWSELSFRAFRETGRYCYTFFRGKRQCSCIYSHGSL